jgi:hypothetical protein
MGMKIINKTDWRTDDLRRIISRVARDELNAEHRRCMRVVIGYSRRNRYTGYAWYNSNDAVLRVGRDSVDPIKLALLAAHELAHCRGTKHRDMHTRRYDFREEYREYYAWAVDMSIRKKEPKKKQTREEKTSKKLVRAAAQVRVWETKVKRATTWLKKWKRRVKSLEKRAAAMER